MNTKYKWLPFDERLIPNIFSWRYPKGPWIKAALFIEMLFAVVAVIGTLLLALLPHTNPSSRNPQTTTTSANSSP